MFAKIFRYVVDRGKVQRVLEIISEMSSRFSRYGGLRRLIMAREAETGVEIQEIYLFQDWKDWRELMERTKSDIELEKLWNEFVKMVGEENVIEEDWEVLEQDI